MDVINVDLRRFLDGEIVAEEAAQSMTASLNEAVGTPPRLSESLEDCLNRVYQDCMDHRGGSWFCRIIAAAHCMVKRL